MEDALLGGLAFGDDARIDWEQIRTVLTIEEGDILWLHYAEGYSYADIAEHLGKQAEAVQKKGSRAKQKVLRHFPELRGMY